MSSAPYYDEGGIQVWHGRCEALLPVVAAADVVLTDPPYPNGVGHFTEDIPAAEFFLQTYQCRRWFVFWDDMTVPPVPLPLVARHIWHRSNTNRPDNYEAIYEFNIDGIKRPSRVFSYPVIYPGLTGCFEATGHPTQKNQRMIEALIERCQIEGTILDPFSGSGTTPAAAKKLGRKCIAIEQELKHVVATVARLAQGVMDFEGAPV